MEGGDASSHCLPPFAEPLGGLELRAPPFPEAFPLAPPRPLPDWGALEREEEEWEAEVFPLPVPPRDPAFSAALPRLEGGCSPDPRKGRGRLACLRRAASIEEDGSVPACLATSSKCCLHSWW